jgi:hypothetical protein
MKKAYDFAYQSLIRFVVNSGHVAKYDLHLRLLRVVGKAQILLFWISTDLRKTGFQQTKKCIAFGTVVG